MVEDKLDNQGGKWDKYAVDDSGSKWDKYSVPDDDLKKKSTPVVSSGIPSQLPSQPDFLKQGASLADNSFLKEISKSSAQSVAQSSPKSKLPLEGFSQKQIDLLKKGVEKPAQKTSGGLMIPTNLPKEDGEDKDEWKLKNLVQNVFANFELAGTSLLADATTLVKDLSKNPYIPDVSSVMKEAEEITGKSIPTPWELDPLGGVIRGLHGNQERMKEVIANNPLPNTFWGKAVSSVASFAPDIAATALLPEAKLAQGASFLAKTGNLLLNNFTKYITTKEALSGYGEARKKGEDIGEASLEGIKGAGRGLKTGVELAILGAGSNVATKSVMNKLEQYGLGNMPTKELVNLGTDLLAYSIISPYANAGLEGRLATADEIANGAGVAALFRLKGAAENIKSNVKLNKALEETLAMKQGAAVSNFVDATPKSIVEVYNSKGSADEFQLRALAAAKKARETTDLQKKAKYVAEASTLVRAANVKQVAEMVINNNDGFAEFKASDLPDSAKKEFLQKAEEINKLLNPFEKAKTDLDNKIKESEDLFSQLSQQAEQSQDPNERAQLEAQAREAKDNAEKFRNELAEVKFNQNRPDANAGKAPVMEGEVAPTEVKVAGEVIEKDNNGDFLPKKFTLNRAGENQAPKIPIESIKEESFGGEMPTDVKQVKLLEIRGRNAEGETVGSVSIEMNDGTRSVYEVKFNDEKLTSLEGGKTEVKPTESEKSDVEKTLYPTLSGSIPLSEALPNGIYKKLDNDLFAYADKDDKIAAIVDKSNGNIVSKSFWNAKDGKWQLPNKANLKDDAKKFGINEDVYIKKYQDAVDILNAEKEVKPTEVKTVEQLRAEEQAEFDSKIPNAEQYRVEGKVDREKLTNEEDIKAFDEVYNKYDKLISPLLEKQQAKDLSKFSEAELEKRQLEIEGSKSGTPENKEFNDIDKELEKREWRSVFDAPLDKVNEVIDNLIKKDKEQPSGFGSYIERSDARVLKSITNKYSKENVKDLTDSEIIKDYKDAMFGNPTSSYSDGMKLRESVKEAQNRGIDVFKELSKEFVKDGYSEQDALDMAKRKLEPILKDLKQSSQKPLELEQKTTEANAKEEYQKIKSNKKKKDFVRNNLPEEFKPLADELTEAQMSEIVDSNFDSKTIKNIQDAVQKQSAAEVLQPKQEEDGGAGGGRKRVEQGKQGNEPTGEGEAKAAEETQPKSAKEGKVEELKTNDKSILKRITGSENISDSVKEKFKDDLKYEVKSKEEAKSIAKNIIKEYGTDDAVTLAEANKFHGDVNSFIFSEAINDTYIKESEAKTPEEKLKYAEQWADYAIRFDESARSKGRFISAISDFYKKSPLGIKFVENERRSEDFKKWYKAKEGSYKEVFDELVQDPKFKSLIGEEVQKGLKEERAAQRQANRKKIEDFFENAKLKGNNLYAVPIPPKVINGALEIMKQSVLAGESVVNAVNKAIEHISKDVKDWDKEKFRKEYEGKLSSIEGKAGKREKEELPEDAKNKILDKFRKKLKGLDESQKEQVIRKSFKQLVENGALEYNDFKKIIAETIGYGEVTPEEAAKITKLVSDINSVDDLAESIRNEGNRSEQNLLKYQKAKKEAEKSATELNKMVYNKTNVANRLMSIMQLNTLGIPSLVNNPIFNIWNQATVRFPNAVSMTVLDQILYGGSKVSNKLFGTGVLLPENNVLASQKEFFKKALQGGKLSTEQLFTGLTNKDYFQKEIYSSQIHPFTSIKDLWNWKFNGKSLTPAQVVDKSIQATVGLPAEIVARALNIGDKPQRFAAEGAQAAVFAKNLGLKDIDYKYFLEFPKEEAYRAFKKQGLSDDVAMKKAEEIQERIIKQGEESTFQQENLVNEVINSAVNIASSYGVGAGGVVKAIKTLNMPFLKIPLNASWSVYNLANPQVAFLQSAIYGARAIKSRSASDIQQSKKWLAHGATGIALTGIAGALVSNGIINASNRSDETSKKERQGEKTYEQQNSINVTKLSAYLRGENPDDVKNSLNVDLKWFGNVGNILNIEAIKKEEMTPEQKENGMSFMEDMFSGMSISSMELIENGVFSNTSGLLTAIDKGGNFADSYVLNLINMGTNIVQPAMFAQMSRAQLPYYSQQKADTFMEELKNNLLTRSSVLRSLSDKYPPSQIGVWGDRLDRKDNVAMNLFGMSSNNNDNFAQPIYNDYKKTNNTAFLPPAVKPEVNGFELNTSQTNKLETLVGQARKNLVSPFVNDGAKLSGFKDRYSQLSEEDKVKALGIIYKMGYQVGEKQFTDLYPEFYKSDKKTPEQKKESKESSIFRKSLKKLIK
jgi:hypothetical protein